jgi:NAD(P)-dependent dehydrogenase (short-subunit alcohol dehydrogenase family)
VRDTVDQLGTLDVLVHCAGGGSKGSILECPPDEWYATFDVHVHAAYHLCREAAPLMVEKKEGAIVLVSSVAGIRGLKFALAYGAAKGAVDHLTRMLAYQLADHSVRVNCVAPGIIRTAFHAAMTQETYQRNVDHRIPLHREGTPEQVAEAILLLVENEYITGESLVIDGGLTSRIA